MTKVEDILRKLGTIEKYFLGAVFSALVLIITYQIIVRWMGLRSLRWVEELCQYIYVCAVMMGCSIGVTEEQLMKVSALEEALPKRFGNILKALINVLCGGFSIYFAILAAKTGSVMYKVRSITTALKMPIGLFYFFIAICLAGWALRSFVRAGVLVMYTPQAPDKEGQK